MTFEELRDISDFNSSEKNKNSDIQNAKRIEENFSLTYNFTAKEISILAKFLRNKQAELPSGLEKFCIALEDSVYNCLTLEEVKRFYS